MHKGPSFYLLYVTFSFPLFGSFINTMSIPLLRTIPLSSYTIRRLLIPRNCSTRLPFVVYTFPQNKPPSVQAKRHASSSTPIEFPEIHPRYTPPRWNSYAVFFGFAICFAIPLTAVYFYYSGKRFLGKPPPKTLVVCSFYYVPLLLPHVHIIQSCCNWNSWYTCKFSHKNVVGFPTCPFFTQ